MGGVRPHLDYALLASRASGGEHSAGPAPTFRARSSDGRYAPNNGHSFAPQRVRRSN